MFKFFQLGMVQANVSVTSEHSQNQNAPWAWRVQNLNLHKFSYDFIKNRFFGWKFKFKNI